MYADAGHAQAGPSTGGYTVELGSTTLHAVSGQHHATTLGTSDSESYEVSRAVATALAFRSFMTEFGFPQRLPTEVKNDNSGTVAKAASDASDKRSLYMKRRVKFVQEAQKLGEVLVVYVQSAANIVGEIVRTNCSNPKPHFRAASRAHQPLEVSLPHTAHCTTLTRHTIRHHDTPQEAHPHCTMSSLFPSLTSPCLCLQVGCRLARTRRSPCQGPRRRRLPRVRRLSR